MKKKKILIVDDNKINLLIAKKLLSTQDCETVTAQSGQEALAQIKINNFDLVLMDIMMPGMDGFETCSRIKKIDSSIIINKC